MRLLPLSVVNLTSATVEAGRPFTSIVAAGRLFSASGVSTQGMPFAMSIAFIALFLGIFVSSFASAVGGRWTGCGASGGCGAACSLRKKYHAAGTTTIIINNNN